MKIGIVGMGLIGGSIAKGIKRVHPETQIVAYYRKAATLQAVEDGVVDEAVDVLDERLGHCDILLFATPVEVTIRLMEQIRPFLSESCLVTDACSTKQMICQAAKDLGIAHQFLGAHPMAGSEKSGYEAAKAHLFENAYYVLTPTEETPADAVEKMKQLAADLRAIPIIIDAKTHDETVAAISHFPHLLAAALVNQVQAHDSEGLMKTLAAGGFRDVTRIAASSPAMWEQICMTNQAPIAAFIRGYIAEMEKVLRYVEEGDGPAIYHMFETAGAYRNGLNENRHGAIVRSHILFCDVVDRPGAIAEIAVLLATRGISIKNIGIVHNRGHVPGALGIAFDDMESKQRAAEVLKTYGFLAE